MGLPLGSTPPTPVAGLYEVARQFSGRFACAIFGDEPAYDGLLERFPQNYHEPYYPSYVNEDFPAMARQCGLTHRRDVTTFVSKVMVFDKSPS